MWRSAGILAVCYLLAIMLGAFAGASPLRLALLVLPLFVLAWLALEERLRVRSRRVEAWNLDSPSPRARESAIERIAELADVGVVQMSRDGTLEFASRRARELLGSGRDDFSIDRWPVIAEAIRRYSDPNSTSSGVYEVDAANGPLTLSFKVHPVFEAEWSGYLVQIRDRRALEALENDVRSAARQEALNQACVGIAHDVRGALNAAVLNLEGLNAEAKERELEPALLARVSVVSGELDRLRRSLEMLLRETTPADGEQKSFDLEDVARAVAAFVDTKASHQGVKVVCEREGWAPVTSRADRIRETALILAINALEAMPRGGTLRFATNGNNGLSRLDVTDTGCGIGGDVLPRIFDLHYTTKAYGTGVGLWAARSIMKSESGHVEVVATGPNGTTFRITLPSGRES
ncbi:MAG: hypothetical protein HYU52_13915 [Acidobacteria bacterium]|nr:hypothetical protein [Acidobacteriota bacterium]